MSKPHPTTLRLLQVALLGLCVWLFATSASAETRVAVRTFSGPGGAQARWALVQVLSVRDGLEVVPNAEADIAAKRRGLRVNTPAGRRAVAQELELSVWIEGSVRKRAGVLTLAVVARSGRSNAVLARFSVKRRKTTQLKAAIKSGMWAALGPAIEGAKPAPAKARKQRPEVEKPVPVATSPTPPSNSPPPPSKMPAPVDTSPAPVDTSPAPVDTSPAPVGESPAPAVASTESLAPWSAVAPDEPQKRELPPLVTPLAPQKVDGARVAGDEEGQKAPRQQTAIQLAVTMNSLHRTLVFSDAFSMGLANYTLVAAPLGDAALRLYPFAFQRSDWLCSIGFDVRGQRAFALKSEGQENAEYPTKYDSYGAGLVGRFPIQRHELNAVVGYNAQRFLVKNAKGEPAPVPSVDYRSIRIGLGGRIAVLERLQLGLEAAWLQLQAVGELATRAWFPRTRGYSFEGMLYADMGLVGTLLNLRARIAYQHSQFDFHPRLGDSRVARSARDGYLTAGLGLAFAY